MIIAFIIYSLNMVNFIDWGLKNNPILNSLDKIYLITIHSLSLSLSFHLSLPLWLCSIEGLGQGESVGRQISISLLI